MTAAQEPCYVHPCPLIPRWEVVDLRNVMGLKACDRHAAAAVRRRIRQLGRHSQVVIRPTGGILHVADLGVLLAVGADVAGVVGREGVPKSVSELTTDAFCDLVHAVGGRISDDITDE